MMERNRYLDNLTSRLQLAATYALDKAPEIAIGVAITAFIGHTESVAATMAFGAALAERRRQIMELNYTPEHDALHAEGELATAAAKLLLPGWVGDEQVCHSIGDASLSVDALSDVLGSSTFEIEREFPPFGNEDDDSMLSAHIADVTRGVALGLAELERLFALELSSRKPSTAPAAGGA